MKAIVEDAALVVTDGAKKLRRRGLISTFGATIAGIGGSGVYAAADQESLLAIGISSGVVGFGLGLMAVFYR